MSTDQTADKLMLAEIGARYCDACDRQDWDAALDLFTEDAFLDASSVYGKTFTGHKEIREFFESAPPCLGHHATGFYSDLSSETEATARLKMLTMFKRNTFTVDYEWKVTKSDGTWKIVRQSFAITGKQDFQAA
ncbi:MAG: nuclear transport factor 2 family protein [Pseudomonadota bacterium]